MEKAIVTGLLAYGMSGKVFHAPFIDGHPGFKFHAILERNQKKAVQDYPGVKSYDTFEDILADQEIELVIVNTPNFTHVDYTRRSLQAGKHVLVEKPFTPTSAEARELFELARSLGKKIFIYHNRRWDSDCTSIQKVVESGQLGKISEVHYRYDRYRRAIGAKTFKEEPQEASGLMYDLGPHLLDQAISLFGKPRSFYKVLGKHREHTKVDDYFMIHLAYPNDLNVFLTSSLLVADPQKAFVLHGSKGSFIKGRSDVQEEQLLNGMKINNPVFGIEAQESKGRLTTMDEQSNPQVNYVDSEDGNYMGLFEAIYQSIVNDVPYPVTEDQIIAQLEILES
ncbi:Gfo/Idh/MocA family oxidoreductase [Pedobacter psychroterrae]|uniref:Oxidoreductase n=1 Tax=Pedobacter psychroterrae TaxID=2530453 RepID=A0A4V2MLT6_9SPHI|nr:Gfo/Idh/MocA family oxidoreductase [Pedobacter psychroterrae]TCD03337.1 oxidoreductase [Pedobacter psychroterrae]